MIRLSNNSLVDTRGLYQLALDLVESPEEIAWLDLSFNDIEEVTDDILEWVSQKMYLMMIIINDFLKLPRWQI